MPPERNRPPQHPPSALARLLAGAVRRGVRAPWWSLAFGLLLAATTVVAAVRGLGFKTSRLDLLNPASSYNQRWLAYLAEFGDQDDLLVVVEADDARQVTPAVDALVAELSRPNRPFAAVLHQRDLSRIKAKGLHFLDDSELRQLGGLIDRLEPVLRGDWSQLSAGRFLRQLNQQVLEGRAAPPADAAAAAAARATLEAAIVRFGDSLSASLEDPPVYRSPWNELSRLTERFREFDQQYLLADGGRRGFVALRFRSQEKKLVAGGAEIAELRGLLESVGRRFPAVRFGLTGLPVLEYDEMHCSQSDMTIASLVSLVGVVGLLLAGFGHWRYALLAVGTLVVGMCWAFGFATSSIGHLNLLSVSFAAILIGLGIDFGIHYLSRYLQLRNVGQSCDEALSGTALGIGPGLVTGAVTTAFAFLSAGLTDFTGVAELGLIAGGGILVCLAAAFWVLPPAIALLDRARPHHAVAFALPLHAVLGPALARPAWPIAAVLLFTLAVTPGVLRVTYDHNLLNLQPRGLESVEVEKRLLASREQSVWFAVSTVGDRRQMLARKAAFESLPTVERTEEILSLVPDSDADKRPLIASVRSRLAALPAVPPLIPVTSLEELRGELTRLEMVVQAIGGSTATTLPRIARLQAGLRAAPPDVLSQRLSQHQQQSARELLERLNELRELAEPTPPDWNDVPSELSTRFVGKTGRHLLRVYARGDIWDFDALGRFVADLESVDPAVTGHPIQTYYASRQMQRSYVHAAIYSLLALLIVLMLDFRRVAHSLLALLPLALGVWQMIGVMGLLALPFNGANMIVLPLILGIGIDNGVHVIHDWRSQPGRYRLSNSLAVSILLCSATTMAGFCSMVFARHEGLRSLGQVLTLALFLCLATSLFFLPALLSWLTRNRSEVDLEDDSPTRTVDAPAPAPASVTSVGSNSAGASPVDLAEPEPPPADSPTSSRRGRRSARGRKS